MSIENWFLDYQAKTGLEIPAEDQIVATMQRVLSEYHTQIQSHQSAYLDLKQRADHYKTTTTLATAGTFRLTAGQSEALERLNAWRSSPDLFYLLKGFAGTGKSHVISLFAKTMEPRGVLFTAPTNKATKVLKTLLPNYTCKTIYSALGLRMVEREDERVLLPSDERVDLSQYGTIVVDESSMLNTELLGYIRRAAEVFGIKFLFVADEAQLPPVGEDISPVFQLTCGQFELTEVVRHDNQILELATHIRNHVFSGQRLSPIVFTPTDVRCVWRLSAAKFYDRLERASYQGFTNMKCIAWRNARVDELNAVIRNQLYSDEDLLSSKWLVNDRIVFTSPVYSDDGKSFLATTDDEGVVTRISTGRDPETGLRAYFVHVKLDFGPTIRIRSIHEDSEYVFSERLSKLASQARQPKSGHLWPHFWKLNNRYAAMRYSYAITAHRAQGSTFHTVFADMGDILSNTDRLTALRCAYVTSSRPSNQLYMTGFPK